jgi:hypothetical protein
MEITKYVLDQKLSRTVKEQANRDVLNLIAEEELGYYERWKGVSGNDVPPNTTEISVYYWMARVFGIIFMMKVRDFFIKRAYASLEDIVSEATCIVEQDISSLAAFKSAMDEERLHYMGALILGLNDAIIEITGAIAGFTFAAAEYDDYRARRAHHRLAGALSMFDKKRKVSETRHKRSINAGS